VTEGEAAPAATTEQQGARNLLMRVAAALVLAPLAIIVAYAGGWFWAALVTLAAIGLYVEWLTVVGARAPLVIAAGAVTLFGAGCFEVGRIGTIYVFILAALGVLGAASLAPDRRGWTAVGGCYAFAALISSTKRAGTP